MWATQLQPVLLHSRLIRPQHKLEMDLQQMKEQGTTRVHLKTENAIVASTGHPQINARLSVAKTAELTL